VAFRIGVVIGDVRPTVRLCDAVSWHRSGAFAAPGFCEASALLSHRSGSGSPPFRSPQAMQLLVWGTAPTRFRVPEKSGQEKRMYLNRITLIGFIGCDAERKVPPTQSTSRYSRSRPRRPGRTMPNLGIAHPVASMRGLRKTDRFRRHPLPRRFSVPRNGPGGVACRRRDARRIVELKRRPTLSPN
jgi:hypothetical protein